MSLIAMAQSVAGSLAILGRLNNRYWPVPFEFRGGPFEFLSGTLIWLAASHCRSMVQEIMRRLADDYDKLGDRAAEQLTNGLELIKASKPG
jgi:hypothetical protein